MGFGCQPSRKRHWPIWRCSMPSTDRSRQLPLKELYGRTNAINTKEMFASAAVRAQSPILPAVISSTAS